VLADRIVWQPDAEQPAHLEIDVESFFAEIHGEA
jgi:hypothetical protein